MMDTHYLCILCDLWLKSLRRIGSFVQLYSSRFFDHRLLRWAQIACMMDTYYLCILCHLWLKLQLAEVEFDFGFECFGLVE
jgi:hypothetical protein